MSKMSLTDKIGVLIEASKNFNFAILIIIILLFLGFTFINSNKNNKTRTKYVYLVSSVFIIVAFVMTYHASLANLFDYMMDNFFIAVYFPNLAIYAFALLITNVILLVSIFNYKISKIIKCINVVVYLLMNYLLSLILNIINTNQLDIFTQKSVYGNTKATALIELSSLLFVIWIIFLIAYRLILIYLKKEYVPPVKKIIRIRKIKKLPANFIPKEVPVYAYGKTKLTKKQDNLQDDLLREYEQLFTIEDYKLLSQILREQKKKELETAKMNFSLETKDREVEEQQQPEKQEPVIIQSHSTDSEDEENKEPDLINTILNEMETEKQEQQNENDDSENEIVIDEFEKIDLVQEEKESEELEIKQDEKIKLEEQEKIRIEEERLKKEHEEKIRKEQENRLRKAKEESLRIEKEKEQRKFTELEMLYRSMV